MRSLQSSRHTAIHSRGQKLGLLLVGAVQVLPRHLVVRLFVYVLFTHCNEVVNNLKVAPDGIRYRGVLPADSWNGVVTHSQHLFLEHAVCRGNSRNFLLRRHLRANYRKRRAPFETYNCGSNEEDSEEGTCHGGALKDGPPGAALELPSRLLFLNEPLDLELVAQRNPDTFGRSNFLRSKFPSQIANRTEIRGQGTTTF